MRWLSAAPWPLSLPSLPPPRCACYAGVPGLPTWLSDRFPDVEFASIDPDARIDALAVDLNSVVHSKLRIARNEEQAIALILKELHAMQRAAPASRFVLLALDGAAPFAKVRTQRRRRQKSQLREARKAENGHSGRTRGLSSLLATPGTAFMKSLESALLYWCSSEALRHGAPGAPPRRFLVSGSETPGEGELKILSWLLHRSSHPSESERVKSAVVVGGDGDLIIHALVLREASQAAREKLMRRRAVTMTRGSTKEVQHARVVNSARTRGAVPQRGLGRGRRSAMGCLDLWVMRSIPEAALRRNIRYESGDRKYSSDASEEDDAEQSEGKTDAPRQAISDNAKAKATPQVGRRSRDAIVSVSLLGEALDKESSHGHAYEAAIRMEKEMANASSFVGLADVDAIVQSQEEAQDREGTARSRKPGGEARAGLDMVILTTMLGNDYMPKIRGASAELIWRAYCALRSHAAFRGQTLAYADSRSVDTRFLAAILRIVRSVNAEASAAAGIADAAGEDPAAAREAALKAAVQPEALCKTAQEAVTSDESVWSAELAIARKIDGPSSVKAYDYLQGMAWLLQMYADGACPDVGYKYPHEHAPHPTSLIVVLDEINGGATAPTFAPVSHLPALPAPLAYCTLVPPAGMDEAPVARVTDEEELRILRLIAEREWASLGSNNGESREQASSKLSADQLSAADDDQESVETFNDGNDIEDTEDTFGQRGPVLQDRSYTDILATAVELPPRLLAPTKALAAQPAWLLVERLPREKMLISTQPDDGKTGRVGSSTAHRPTNRAGVGLKSSSGPIGLPRPPRMPPPPPTKRMRPLRSNGQLSCSWEVASWEPVLPPWRIGLPRDTEGQARPRNRKMDFRGKERGLAFPKAQK